MRSNRASDAVSSTCTFKSWPIGKNRRLWSVVKATMSPAVGADGSPFIARAAASQYTKAGMMLKIVPITMKNQRPIIAWRTCSRARPRLSSRNRAVAAACWPKVFVSRTPETLSVSCVTEVMSASATWVSVETARRARPTRWVRNRKKGSIPSDSSVSRQSMRTMAMTVEATTATLEATLVAVSVTTACTPPTSFARRLWISPVRVSVKKRRGSRWRWA